MKQTPGRIGWWWHTRKSGKDAAKQFKTAEAYWKKKGFGTQETLAQHLLLERINSWRRKKSLPTFRNLADAQKIRVTPRRHININEVAGWTAQGQTSAFDPLKVSRSNRLEQRWKKGEHVNTTELLAREKAETKAREEAEKAKAEAEVKKRAQEEGG